MRVDRGEVTAERGGLRARFQTVGDLFLRPAALRIAAALSGLVLLGVLGQCLGTPAAAQMKDDSIRVPRGDPLAAIRAPDAAGVGVGTSRVDGGPLQATALADAAARDEPAEPLDLNRATEGELRRLPGIGPRRAAQILELRERLGGFRRIDDLVRVRGIGRTVMKRLRPLVRVGDPLRR